MDGTTKLSLTKLNKMYKLKDFLDKDDQVNGWRSDCHLCGANNINPHLHYMYCKVPHVPSEEIKKKYREAQETRANST